MESRAMESQVLPFLALVREMRGQQQLYFHTHGPEVLLRAKTAERAVDRAEAELRKAITGGEQGKLF